MICSNMNNFLSCCRICKGILEYYEEFVYDNPIELLHIDRIVKTNGFKLDYQ